MNACHGHQKRSPSGGWASDFGIHCKRMAICVTLNDVNDIAE